MTNKDLNPDDINRIRDDIDRIDNEILKLMAERKAHSLRIAKEKDAQDRPSRDQLREEDLIADRIATGMDHDLDAGLVNRVWREIVNDSVRIQQELLGRSESLGGPVTVAIQGIEGSYSQLASQQFFDSKGISATYVRSATFGDAIAAVQRGEAEVAVLPIENTTSGAISEVYDLLLNSRLHFVGDVKFRVRHCLLGIEGATIAGLERIYCHPQAVAQCSEFLAGLENVEVVYFSDTALSGKRIKELNDPAIAAIASEQAAKLFGLDVLQSAIANRDENYTRFVVVAREPAEVPDGVASKTSIVMAVGNHPGALMDALAIFHEADINLVMLESRPIPDNPREELFYLDFDGNTADPEVEAVLEELT
ncbi:MAG: prephenate dehydratase domain-containing protein, partial [Acidimicrobiia bacterium]